jgi:hypothetical protein
MPWRRPGLWTRAEKRNARKQRTERGKPKGRAKKTRRLKGVLASAVARLPRKEMMMMMMMMMMMLRRRKEWRAGRSGLACVGGCPGKWRVMLTRRRIT